MTGSVEQYGWRWVDLDHGEHLSLTDTNGLCIVEIRKSHGMVEVPWVDSSMPVGVQHKKFVDIPSAKKWIEQTLGMFEENRFERVVGLESGTVHAGP